MPLNPEEHQKLILQREIAKLSGAIHRHASSHPSSSAYHPYGRGRPRGGPSNRARGRGRGGSYSLDLRSSNQSSPAASSPVPGSSTPIATDVENAALPAEPETSWVKTNKAGNMSMMTVQKRKALAARPPRPSRPEVPPQVQVLTSSTTNEGQRVVIDGVIFQFEQGGKKLTRIGELNPSDPRASTSSQANTPTRKKVDYDGQRYRRTSRGNLVQRRPKAEMSKVPCRYYTKTGRCNKALTCPFAHIPDRLAICSKFLRSTCPNTAATCPLSHNPSPHNTPSCVHFQATSTCRNGSECVYPHVKVSSTAGVCEAFARGGWCDAPPGTCPELHIWECGEWRAKGTCSRGKKCGLKHVLRAENGKGSAREATKEGIGADQEMGPAESGVVPPEGGFEDGAEFINFDIGSPAAITSDDESEADHEAEDSEGSDGSDEGEDGEEDEEEDEGAPSPTARESLRMETDDEEDEDEVLGVVF